MRQYKIIVEKHPDGYVAYPLGFKGVVVGQGDTYEEALKNIKEAVELYLEPDEDDLIQYRKRKVVELAV